MSVTERDRLADGLADLLRERPGLTKHQLRQALSVRWPGLTTREVNSVLYEAGRPFRWFGTETVRLWTVAGVQQSVAAPRSIPVVEPRGAARCYTGPTLRLWQSEALAAWEAAGRRGVVEAVTGTGKTAVGVATVADAVERGLPTLVVVPTRDLLDQWHEVLSSALRGVRIGRLGDGWSGELQPGAVLVSTVQSASRHALAGRRSGGLIVADEVHRYGAASFSRALEPQYAERLGLTATYEREDNGVDDHLKPYFGEVVAECSYERGLRDGILASFRVALVGVDFTNEERDEYMELDEAARRYRGLLINQHDCPAAPFGEFMRDVALLSEGGHADAVGTKRARAYLNAFSKRRSLLADCQRKLVAADRLRGVLAASDRALVFTETVTSAEAVAERLGDSGLSALDYTSDLDRDDRKQRLRAFREGRVKVLCAPRVLDEGVDVPQADVGVILAASRSKRQMIQRMGRIIRPK